MTTKRLRHVLCTSRLDALFHVLRFERASQSTEELEYAGESSSLLIQEKYHKYQAAESS